MNQKEHFTSSALATSFTNAKGPIPYNMTNDYMFRAVLQSNNKVLRGLICALLHLQESDIRSVEITNTIIHGQDYDEIKSVIHIGFLNFTLFKEYPEFYAIYKLINVNNQHIYSDKMTLCVVDLSKIDLATDIDKESHIDKWAALFKATTWEEIQMIADNNEYLNEASQTIYHMNSDYWIRKACIEREEYHLDMHRFQLIIAEQKEALTKQEHTISQLKAEIELLKSQQPSNIPK